VNLFFPIVYIIASLFVTVVPMIASPVETGKFLSYLVFWQYTSLIVGSWFIQQSCVKCILGGIA
jgi:hypothetical protein